MDSHSVDCRSEQQSLQESALLATHWMPGLLYVDAERTVGKRRPVFVLLIHLPSITSLSAKTIKDLLEQKRCFSWSTDLDTHLKFKQHLCLKYSCNNEDYILVWIWVSCILQLGHACHGSSLQHQKVTSQWL